MAQGRLRALQPGTKAFLTVSCAAWLRSLCPLCPELPMSLDGLAAECLRWRGPWLLSTQILPSHLSGSTTWREAPSWVPIQTPSFAPSCLNVS